LRQRVATAISVGRNCAGGTDNWLIAGAAAKVALQRCLDLLVARVRRTHPQRIKRHHETRSAEPALRAVEIHDRLLHRMQLTVCTLQMLDGNDMGRIQRTEEADACIDAL